MGEWRQCLALCPCQFRSNTTMSGLSVGLCAPKSCSSVHFGVVLVTLTNGHSTSTQLNHRKTSALIYLSYTVNYVIYGRTRQFLTKTLSRNHWVECVLVWSRNSVHCSLTQCWSLTGCTFVWSGIMSVLKQCWRFSRFETISVKLCWLPRLPLKRRSWR